MEVENLASEGFCEAGLEGWLYAVLSGGCDGAVGSIVRL